MREYLGRAHSNEGAGQDLARGGGSRKPRRGRDSGECAGGSLSKGGVEFGCVGVHAHRHGGAASQGLAPSGAIVVGVRGAAAVGVVNDEIGVGESPNFANETRNIGGVGRRVGIGGQKTR